MTRVMPTSRSSLFGDLDVQVTTDAPIGAWTWYGIGGRADVLLSPNSVDALATLVQRCARSGTPLRVMGSGANLLVADEGVGGVVVRLDHPTFREITYGEMRDPQRLRAMAGADMARTLMDCTRRGLDGLSPMAGIPASIGGALRMNAGGRFGSIGDVVHSVTCLTKRGEVVTYPREELLFDYRRTNIPDPIILSAVFALREADPIELRQIVKENFAFKKSTQPLGDHSAGCAFKNPLDPVTERRVSAGKLIDEAGLKGLTAGGAEVSRHHANFIIVKPGALAGHVLALLDMIRQRVFDHAGIELQEEIVVWRRDDEGR
jgi:UDP-N-acetylmuramate dehydrogenase